MDNIRMEEVGKRIQSERKRYIIDGKSMSLDQLAEKISVARQTISKWEKGEGAGPTVWDLLRMCEVFGCDYGYLVGDYDCRTRTATDIQEDTGLSEAAIDNLLVSADGPFEGPMDEIVEKSQHDELRAYEVGRFAKIRFIEALLENSEELERLAVAAYDYRKQIQLFNREPLHTVNGIRHDQFASVAKEAAKEALSDLFRKITWDVLDGIEWTGEG
jgi:transcriptional regulator with XRE-family HTH domain